MIMPCWPCYGYLRSERIFAREASGIGCLDRIVAGIRFRQEEARQRGWYQFCKAIEKHKFRATLTYVNSHLV